MNSSSIFELLLQLPAITEVSITCFSKNHILVPMKDAVHNLQLTYYWWKEADAELRRYVDTPELIQNPDDHQYINRAPTLISTKEQLEYIMDNLKNLSEDTQKYLEEYPLPMGVKYKIEQGYNNVMEALFNADISTKYYEEYNRQQSESRNGSSTI